MQLKKKVSLLKLTNIKEKTSSNKSIYCQSAKPSVRLNSSQCTNYQNNKTQSSTRRTDKQELQRLIKLRNDLKTKLLICKDTISETMLIKCFKNINTRIKKLTDNQIKYTLNYTPQNSKTDLLFNKHHFNYFDTKNNKYNQDEDLSSSNPNIDLTNEEKENKSAQVIKSNDKYDSLYKQMTQLNNIQKDIVLLDIKSNEDYIHDFPPKHFFIRENILRQKQPNFRPNIFKQNKQMKKKLNLSNFNFKNRKSTKFKNNILVQSQSHKSHNVFLRNKILNTNSTKVSNCKTHKVNKNKIKQFHRNTQCISAYNKVLNDFGCDFYRPLTSDNTRQNSLQSKNTIKTTGLITEASNIISNMNIIECSIKQRYYSENQKKNNTNNEYDKQLLSLYNKKEDEKQSELIKSSIIKLKKHKKKEYTTNTMEKEMIKTLSTIPSSIKKTFRETFKIILNEHRLLNKPMEYIPNPYEQRKAIRKMYREFCLATQKKILMLQSINCNNMSKETEELTAPPKDNKYISINELEWLIIKRRVLKPDRMKTTLNRRNNYKT